MCRLRSAFLLIVLVLLPRGTAEAQESFRARERISGETVRSLSSSHTLFRAFNSKPLTKLRLPSREGNREALLVPHDIRHPSFRAEETTASGRHKVASDVQLFRGTLEGENDEFVRVALFPGDGLPGKTGKKRSLEGIFKARGTLYSILPNPGDADEIIIEELKPEDLGRLMAECGLEATLDHRSAQATLFRQQGDVDASALRVLQVASDVDFEYSSKYGGGTAANARVLGILNGVDAIYEAQLNLTISVTYQHAWTTSSDPYTATGASGLLDQMTQYWENNLRSGRTYDVSHLWTGRDLDAFVIGVAFLGSVCTNEAYGLSQDLESNSYDVPLAAHEIGHNLGAMHDNCSSGPPWIMCPILIQNVSQFSTTSKSQIASVVSQSSCLAQDNTPPSPPSNRPPVLNGIGARTVSEGSTLVFQVSASDPDGHSLTYSASGLPPGALFSSQNFFYAPDFNAVTAGASRSFSVTIAVTDSGGRSDSETFVITVNNVNRAPVITAIPDRSVAEDVLLSISAAGNDPDGNALTFSGASALPAGMTVSPNGTISWRPAGDQSGSYNVTISAKDPFGASDTDTFVVTVTNTPGALALPSKHAAGDFDGDGGANAALFRHSTGEWVRRRFNGTSFTGEELSTFGLLGDVPVAGDYNGDRISDLAVFRPAIRTWYIANSRTGVLSSTVFGVVGDLPAPADYDGDGRTDIAIYRPSSHEFVIRLSSDGTDRNISLGQEGDIPVSCDYNGDGRAEPAVFRPEGALWLMHRSGGNVTVQFGERDDYPVPADFNSDGICETAVFRPREGAWYLGAGAGAISFGEGSEYPLAADFTGDGTPELALFRPRDHTWLIRRGDGTVAAIAMGSKGDLPAQPSLLLYALANAHGSARARESLNLSSAPVYDSRKKTLYSFRLSSVTSRKVNIPRGTALVRGDYNGDGMLDEALVKNGKWSIFHRQGNRFPSRASVKQTLGTGADLPLSGDFDGDGATDLAVVGRHGDTLFWQVLRSASATLLTFSGGAAGDEPLAADFNGDGRSDFGVWKPSQGVWEIYDSRSGKLLSSETRGSSDDQARAADFDGDSRADEILWNRATGAWRVFYSGGGGVSVTLGKRSDTPYPGYFFSPERADFAVYRPSSGSLMVVSQTGATAVRRAKKLRGGQRVLTVQSRM